MTVNYCSYYFGMFSVIMPWSNQLAFRKYAVCTCLVINHNSKKLLAKTMVQISKRLVNQKKKFYKILCMNLFYCPLTSYYAAYFVSYSSLVRPRPNLQKNRVWGFRFWNLFKWVNEDGFFGFLMYFFLHLMIVFKWSGPEVGWSEPSQDKTIILYDILLKKPNMVNDMHKIFQVILHIIYLSKLGLRIS